MKAWTERARDRRTIAACVASSADGTVRSVFSGMCGDWQHVQRDQGGRNVAQLVRAVSELKAGNDSSFNSRLHGLVVSPSDARGFKALRRVSLRVTSNRKVETHEMSTAARGGGCAVVATRSDQFVCMCERGNSAARRTLRSES